MSKIMLTLLFVLAVVPTGFTGTDRSRSSPYEGQYAGPFTAKFSYMGTPTKQIGKITLSINHDGDASGKVDNYTSGRVATLRGSIEDNGTLTLVCKYPGSTTTVKGPVNKTNDGHLKGELTQYEADDTVLGTVEIDLKSK